MLIDNEVLSKVDAKLCKRYSDRLEKYGRDPKTLGWDTLDNQYKRFSTAYRFLPMSFESIVDIGCGLADFYEFINLKGNKVEYSGIDINPDLLAESKKRFPKNQYYCTNIIKDDVSHISSQWGVMFGVLNFRFSEFDNVSYAKQMIKNAFSLVTEGLIVDMLSSHICNDYKKEDFVYYYEPSQMLNIAMEFTPYVTLVHDYAAIPQREFFLILRRSPCKS